MSCFPKALRLAGLCLGLVAFFGQGAQAADLGRVGPGQSFWSATHLIEVKYDADHTKWLSPARSGGFETSQGHWVSFRPWYDNKGLRNTSLAWITQISSSFGVIWGVGTGERAAKYVITPSLKVGAVYQTQLSKNSLFSVQGTTILGGYLREKTCIGNYDLEGEQEVNCRLAASVLPPAETLKYLYRERPYNHSQLQLQFSLQF